MLQRDCSPKAFLLWHVQFDPALHFGADREFYWILLRWHQAVPGPGAAETTLWRG